MWFLVSAKWLEQAEKGEIAPNWNTKEEWLYEDTTWIGLWTLGGLSLDRDNDSYGMKTKRFLEDNYMCLKTKGRMVSGLLKSAPSQLCVSQYLTQYLTPR